MQYVVFAPRGHHSIPPLGRDSWLNYMPEVLCLVFNASWNPLWLKDQLIDGVATIGDQLVAVASHPKSQLIGGKAADFEIIWQLPT